MSKAEEILKESFGHAYGMLHPLMHIAPILNAMKKIASSSYETGWDRGYNFGLNEETKEGVSHVEFFKHLFGEEAE